MTVAVSARAFTVAVGLLAIPACAGKSADSNAVDSGIAGAGGAGARAGAAGRAGTGGGTSIGGRVGTGGSPGTGGSSTYDQTVLSDQPVAYWAMNKTTTSEPDLSGNGNTGSYRGGAPALSTAPNGDQAASFNGSNQYLTVPSSPSFSIPTTHNLTWEAWIRPEFLQFPNDSNGYVDWMGKCATYSPTCEWEARMYSTTNAEGRCNRISAYVFNPTANLGSAADWQPTCGLVAAARWYHVVGEYTTLGQPAGCANAGMYPGAIDIWVNGVKWSQANHGQTGCMSQYNVIPVTNNSPLNIGTMAGDAWFPGAIAKVAFYNRLLTQTQITNHYRVMTGQLPTGACGNTCAF
jgi:Concanavalin A-like lectin/glucanases superfamily